MKRRWWFWLLLVLVCLTIVFVVSELTSVSIGSIFGWGALGVFGILGVIVALMLGAVFFILPITMLVKFLLECFISNREMLYMTLGSLGFCAILVGWILTIWEPGWSFLVVMVGFSMGCLAGAEYQGHKLEREKLEYELEQVPDKKEDDGDKDSLLKAMSISELEQFKEVYKGNPSVVKILDEYIEAKGKGIQGIGLPK